MSELNDKEIEQDLNEQTTHADIETTDQNLSIDDMFQEVGLPSLGRQIFSEADLEGPTAALFNIAQNITKDGFNLLRNEVEVFPSVPIKTGITEEAVDNIRRQYGKSAKTIIGGLFRGLTNEAENAQTLTFLDAKSLSMGTLPLTDANNSKTIFFEITQAVNSLVLKANSKNVQTIKAFCVLPYGVASSMSIGARGVSEGGLHIATVGNIAYFMNPDPAATTAYVGLRDDNISKSAAVFSPYATTISEALDPNTGESKYHIFNRYAITASPLHRAGHELMFKFEITGTTNFTWD